VKACGTLLCIFLLALGVVLVLRTTPSQGDLGHPATSLDPTPSAAAADPSSPVDSAGRGMPSTTTAGKPDQAHALQQRVIDLKAQHDGLVLDHRRQRELWRQRWATDSAAFQAGIAANDRTIADETQRLKELEARLEATIAEARAEAEREKRERAEQAAAATKAPTPQGVSDF
jgi:hypothetical protein